MFKRPISIVFIITLCLLVYVESSNLSYIDDDAFISARYARNLVNGHGLVFNPGERIEGITNLLWTLILAIPHLLDIDFVGFARALSIILVGLLFTCMAGYCITSLKLSDQSSWLAILLIALSATLYLWSLSGLESALFTLLVFLGIAREYKQQRVNDHILQGVIWGVSFAIRPDALVFLGALISFRFFFAKQTHRPGGTTWLVIFFLPLFIMVEGFRLCYYGALIPNSYYLRSWQGLDGLAINLVPGAIYTGRFLISSGLWMLLPLAMIGNLQKHREFQRFMWIFFLYFLYMLWVGGDSKVFYRLWLPLLPLGYIWLAYSIDRLNERLRNRKYNKAIIAMAVFLVISATCAPTFNCLDFGDHERTRNIAKHLHPDRVRTGRYLARAAGPDDTLALSAIGVIPYLSGLYTYDFMGLIDPRIKAVELGSGFGMTAHRKSLFYQVIKDRPIYVVMSTVIRSREIDYLEKVGYQRIGAPAAFPVFKYQPTGSEASSIKP